MPSTATSGTSGSKADTTVENPSNGDSDDELLRLLLLLIVSTVLHNFNVTLAPPETPSHHQQPVDKGGFAARVQRSLFHSGPTSSPNVVPEESFLLSPRPFKVCLLKKMVMMVAMYVLLLLPCLVSQCC
jgi:hypothetical protein